MGEITREAADVTETEDERKARKERKKARKKLKKARKKTEAAERERRSEEVVVVPLRETRRDPYSYYSHNKSAHWQSVTGYMRIAGWIPEGEDDGY